MATTLGCATLRRRSDGRRRLRYLGEWGVKGSEPGQLKSPIGIAIDANDCLFVTDVQNARVQRFDAEGRFLSEARLGPGLPKPAKMTLSAGIAVDGDGAIYVSVMDQDAVLVFDAEGRHVRTWGTTGTEPGQFDQPGGMALDGDVLYVSDQVNRRVQAFSREGEFLREWGAFGAESGSFDGIEPEISRFGGPHWVAADGAGRLYTTEGALGRVQCWTREGTWVDEWGNSSDDPGGFGALETDLSTNRFGPIGACCDRAGNVWISSLNSRVQLYSPEGRYLGGIGEYGEGPGQFVTPHGMAVASNGDLYVVDSGNHRVQRFAVE